MATAQADVDQLVVTSTADPGDGICDSTCTLRDAILAANDIDAAFELDEITFASSVTGTITLSSSLPQIDDRVRITGPGVSALTVDAGATAGVLTFTGIGGAVSYLTDLTLTGGANVITAVNASNLVIKHAVITGGTAAGVYVDDTSNTSALVSMENSTVSGNGTGVLGSGNRAYFNAIYTSVDDNDVGISLEGGGTGFQIGTISGNADGGVQVADSSASFNRATISGNHGTGGIRSIYVDGDSPASDGYPHVDLNASTVSGNTSDTDGGGISAEGFLHLYGSTVSGNSAVKGGGVEVPDSSYAYAYFSTFSGNNATVAGGAMHLAGDAFAGLESSTISGNTASPGTGGGISAPGGSSFLALYNTIVANSSGPDLVGAGGVSAYYALVEAPGTVSMTGSPNITGVDPELGPLGDNGGRTKTLKPSATSRVLDAGYAPVFPGNDTVYDQRGVLRPQDLPGVSNVPGGDGSDIGAVELMPSEGPPYMPPPTEQPPVGQAPSPTNPHKAKCKKGHKRSAESAKRKCKKKRK